MTERAATQAGAADARETAGLYLAVSLGSVIGSVSRALVSLAAVAWLGEAFLLGTLTVNVLGSFIIGYYATMTGPGGRIMASTRQRQLVMTGFCGGFTTFSAFSLETLMLAQAGHLPLAGLYIALSVVTWLAAAWLGQVLAIRSNRM
ncbi:MAG: CrcB family protein [Alphaproteobacteria bacterium]|nr:CrcB family protein [Alphaproteobacteria bacterium]MBU0804172.1 CrcB family protein [Alphaproteobacteria bacterium]MBU0871003.1 CrcB family protein [Alphaproteobacteria bacterium]MBU1400758.1 CrcB family protein [Alphaproteobacteria bacterium]MBU1592825.1 CrcB family protein [Alphaproteobacteria bacterium]